MILSVMLSEVNFLSDRLNLPTPHPITSDGLQMVHLSDYHLSQFEGGFEAGNYAFDFSESGRLHYISKVTEPGGFSFFDYQRTLRSTNITLTTNEAYRVAASWLRSVDVDLTRLERDHPVTVTLRAQTRVGEHIQVPLYWVDWGSNPTVEVLLSAVTGDLLWLRQEDDSYSRRPVGLIRNVDRLLAISDLEFSRYNSEQRTKLVYDFAAIHYSSKGEHVASEFPAGKEIDDKRTFLEAVMALRRTKLELQHSDDELGGHQQSAINACDRAIQELEFLGRNSKTSIQLSPPFAGSPSTNSRAR
ncbi:MAG TPA: hypothetical protein VMA13_03855 [Candidatus Saccharimonadales bacterium]|nr:hypothetical protein [Candidatus Saccharimonadales bacterium]